MTESDPTSWPIRVASVAVPAFAIGWFLLEWLAMGQSAADAFGEALGAGLGLLVVLSLVGAVAGARRRRAQP